MSNLENGDYWYLKSIQTCSMFDYVLVRCECFYIILIKITNYRILNMPICFSDGQEEQNESGQILQVKCCHFKSCFLMNCLYT